MNKGWIAAGLIGATISAFAIAGANNGTNHEAPTVPSYTPTSVTVVTPNGGSEFHWRSGTVVYV